MPKSDFAPSKYPRGSIFRLHEAFGLGLPAERRPKGCWNWQGTLNQGGYGVLRQAWTKGDGTIQIQTAHRACWFLLHGEIPKGMLILHICDNRKCVNPRHLYLGTPGDNAKDAKERGKLKPTWKTNFQRKKT